MDESQQDIASRVAIWRSIISGAQKSWVLFEHDTCLILMEPEEDLAAQACQIMSTWGPVKVGTPAGDFNVITLTGPTPGWVVGGHHPDMLNYVSPENEDFASPDPSTMVVGMVGRANRDQDAHELKVIHIEDKRLQA